VTLGNEFLEPQDIKMYALGKTICEYIEYFYRPAGCLFLI
jgi:hypothetical protein